MTETTQLIDRYKFLDLFPCSAEELRLVGYSSSAGARSTLSSRLLSAPLPALSNGMPNSAIAEAVDNLPKPDTAQMVPFKVSIRNT